ncbi:MAG: SURF1 family protein [Gammaproteobacteria bacterium]|nr:MAG: SURF1 family protein [Gammaproteobacteria bacterium]
MQIANKTFKPGLFPTVAFLLVLPVLLHLGFWQLDRAEEKRELIELFKQQNELGPLLIKDSIKLDAKLNYRTAKVEGQYNLSKQIFIDNKIYQGKTGVYVMTPFKLKNSENSILINRGWVPMAVDRLTLPKIKTAKEELKLLGKIKILSKKPFTVGEQFQSNTGWPALMQWINIQEVEKKSGLKLLPYIFLLDEKEQSGYIRNWKPVVMQPEKSTSYAVQWFTLALALIIIYIVVNLKDSKSEFENGE